MAEDPAAWVGRKIGEEIDALARQADEIRDEADDMRAEADYRDREAEKIEKRVRDAEAAWRDWDLDTLRRLRVISAREQERMEDALESAG